MAERFSLRMAANGRVVLPKVVREALELKEGGILVASVEGGEVILTTMAKRIDAVQASYKANVKRPQTSDEFLAQRKQDALAERTFETVDQKWRA